VLLEEAGRPVQEFHGLGVDATTLCYLRQALEVAALLDGEALPDPTHSWTARTRPSFPVTRVTVALAPPSYSGGQEPREECADPPLPLTVIPLAYLGLGVERGVSIDQRHLLEVEARTQELGRVLHNRVQAHRPTVGERLQDRLMMLFMEDHALRSRVLRYVDVLAALPEDPFGRQTASLFREYFDASFQHLPRWLWPIFGAARSRFIPDPLIRLNALYWTRLIASRFIVPPSTPRIVRTLKNLEEAGRYPSFDLLGEAVLSEKEAQRYRRRYLELLADLGTHPLAGTRTPGGAPGIQVSLKLTSLTSQFNPADLGGTLRRVRPALEEICQAAREQGIGITLDTEQYATRDLTWRIFREVLGPGGPFADWADAGIVVQAYLRDAEQLATEVLAFARGRGVPFAVRLVKGAYWDYEVIVAEQTGWPMPVHRNKGATDVSYERLVRLLLEDASSIRLAVGSHNVRSHAYAEATREVLGLPDNTVEHQTLYRTLEGLSRALARMGWVERDYVPVGELIPGMAYLVRRILENTSQVGFLTKARLEENVSELLRAPQPGPEDQPYKRPPHPTGFVNEPPARLFDAVERERFQQALAGTRARWGATYPLRLGSESIETSERMPSLSPSHPDPAHPVGWVHLAGLEQAERAVALANAEQPAWAARPPAERAAIGLRAAGLLRGRKYEIAAWVVHEGGKDWHGALADVEEAIDHIDWNARALLHLTPQIEAGYRPVGVVACIPPWNFPIALPAGMTSAALLAGNAVILESAERTPIIAQALTDLLHQAGVPEDVLIHLPGLGGTVGARLVESADVDMVAFTGSKATGTWIYRTASAVAPRKGGVKRVVAEMGGKNAIVVFPDADMDEAVQAILNSAFGHAGQKCSACSRVLVHSEVYERLRSRLVEAARSLPIGPADEPGTAINPVIDSEAREKIASYGETARREGRLLLDLLDGDGSGGSCTGPLVLELDAAKVPTARVAQEEIFGPILSLIRFESEEEAVSLVNSTVYALTLGIFSRSPGVISRMIRACQAGNIYVNREIAGARVGIEPFGGFQLSGTGPKAGSEEYLLAFMTRSSGYRTAPGGGDGARTHRPDPHRLDGLRPWDSVSVTERLRQLRAGIKSLEKARPAIERAVAAWKGLSLDEASWEAARVLEMASAVLAAAPEVADPQPTVEIPGQRNFVLWNTPRGVGVAAVDDGSDPASLAGLVFGPLLAGNGLVVVTTPSPAAFAEVLVGALHRAGVPRAALALADPNTTLEALAASPLHFAAVDLDLERTRSLYRVLGVTEEDSGQRWLKALLSVSEGPGPAEAGFLRRFANPKAVAIRTLRHGAELELV